MWGFPLHLLYTRNQPTLNTLTFVAALLFVIVIFVFIHKHFNLFSQKLIDECRWKEYKSDSGRPYFHDCETKESRWTIPEELEKLKGIHCSRCFK